jgi:hypothetical protein
MITTLDRLIAGMKPPQGLLKANFTAEAAGAWHSLWKIAGLPGAGYACSRLTPGAIPFTNPASGASYLARLAFACGNVATMVLYDRLWACSGFDTTSVLLQVIAAAGDLPARDRNGESAGDGVEMWLEVYAAPGTTAATWTVTYVNSEGTGGRTTTFAHPANAEAVGMMIPLPLAAGDTGVRQVTGFQCSVSSGTAGNVGITLLRRIAEVPVPAAGVVTLLDGVSLGLPRIFNDSCLAMAILASTTSMGAGVGSLVVAEG